MSDVSRRISTAAEYVSILSTSFARRLAISVLLTSLDAGVVARFGVPLYRASADHVSWLVGLTLLFAMMLGSLTRVWILTLRDRSS